MIAPARRPDPEIFPYTQVDVPYAQSESESADAPGSAIRATPPPSWTSFVSCARFVQRTTSRLRPHVLRLGPTQPRRHQRSWADYLKSILTRQNLSGDLRQQAQSSRLYIQYPPGAPTWLARPVDLPGTHLTFAFEAD
jgi:hypothetical protein